VTTVSIDFDTQGQAHPGGSVATYMPSGLVAATSTSPIYDNAKNRSGSGDYATKFTSTASASYVAGATTAKYTRAYAYIDGTSGANAGVAFGSGETIRLFGYEVPYADDFSSAPACGLVVSGDGSVISRSVSDYYDTGFGYAWLTDEQTGGAGSFPFQQWVRVEAYCETGHPFVLKLYHGANLETSTPSLTLTAAAAEFNGLGTSGPRFGIMLPRSASSRPQVWVDDFAWSDTGWVGSSSAPSTVRRGWGVIR
jgi:hypothetical protein